jgi:hypothetical protein
MHSLIPNHFNFSQKIQGFCDMQSIKITWLLLWQLQHNIFDVCDYMWMEKNLLSKHT